MPSSYDVLGNIIILKFSKITKKSDKIKFAKKLLKERKSVETVLEKSEKVKGCFYYIKNKLQEVISL